MANININILESEEKLKECFNFFDENRNGSISNIELLKIFESTNEAELINKLLKETDLDNNGEVTIIRFLLKNSKLLFQNF